MSSVSLPPFLSATLLITIPALGFLSRGLNRWIPNNGADQKKRLRGVTFIAFGILRSVILGLGLWKAPEFFANWFTPTNASEELQSIILYTTGLYCSMLIYELTVNDLSWVSILHHTAALIGNGILLVGVELHPLYPFFVHLYRMGTLMATPIFFSIAYFYLGQDKKPALRLKLSSLRLTCVELNIACIMSNSIGLAFYFTHFKSLPNILRVLLLVCNAAFIPEQIQTSKVMGQWQRKLSIEIKRRLSSPVLTTFPALSALSMSSAIQRPSSPIKRVRMTHTKSLSLDMSVISRRPSLAHSALPLASPASAA
ncbi:uncharacterized protein SPPG_00015 [Spizellomyces punctatus DAOM BR117]|uniref:TLC domain-containing protein n=1 Tax=Spizellomyces punctatus (strain DAOM BR117) TaxID=645134 RepID=A0A0L0HT54_SPIPD|nr:uncharacterized protein SPPG_00015 [Spizellomyces punctatus DAOM BR117]KND04277.1 hypothetical protein SPPG_00015 [Spizellomyces punctatus DAOM BR117]|eukprot:XP_016612316.1 hypothetical protein SPPG_00015 [Spizellomyces punctatus DAOM BR117]